MEKTSGKVYEHLNAQLKSNESEALTPEHLDAIAKAMQGAYYWGTGGLGLDKAVYMVFTPRHIEYPEDVLEGIEVHEGLQIMVFLVAYDEEKDF